MNSVMDMATREERKPYARFSREAVEDVVESRNRGCYVAKNVDYVRITPAYTKDVIVREVASWFEKLRDDERQGRVPPTWLPQYKEQYELWKNGQEAPLDGTPIRGWGAISPAVQETLCHMQILTVEDAAMMNDDAIRRVGIGGVDVRNKARAHMQAAKDIGPLVMQNAELQAKLTLAEANVETLSQRLDALVAQIEAGVHSRQPAPQVEEAMEYAPEPAITAESLMEPDLNAMSDGELGVAYTVKFGTEPHHRMKRQTIIEKLQE